MRNDNTIQVRVSTELKAKLEGRNLSEEIREFLEGLVEGSVLTPQPSPKKEIVRPSVSRETMNPAMRKFLEQNGEK